MKNRARHVAERRSLQSNKMITPTDKDYIETKLVLNKQRILSQEYTNLKNWISKKYNQRVINIILDKIPNRPRLNIVLEEYKSKREFMDSLGNFDIQKQKSISLKFKEQIGHKTKLNSENLLVIFTAFNPIARAEANKKVSTEFLKYIQGKYFDSRIWLFSKFGSGVTLFFYHEEDVNENRNSQELKLLTQEYFTEIKKYDEFDLITTEDFKINIDSKENIDKNYNSNLYNYYR